MKKENYMKFQLNGLKHLSARITNKLFLIYTVLQVRLLSKRKMKILFSSHPGLEAPIRDGFKFTPHEITFSELSQSNIKDYDLVVPLTIGDLKYLNTIRNQIIDNPIPIPSMESIELCDDKDQLNQLLIAHNFGIYIPKIGGTQTFPYILKKKIDYSGENSHIIFNSEQELLYSEILSNPEYFTQELITGPLEYATHILFKNQKIVYSINIEYNFETETPIKGKTKSFYLKVCRNPYHELFASILKSTGFEGICCFNYKVRDNLPMIIEINPRFGGSLAPYFPSFMKHLN
ncbi:MAG: hypothetical protein Q8K83_07225 [Methylotenera sp.]|nr:hypothetical protein [Methylotenera sp.]